ncbi:MAG: enoyl-CoA hydratase/isomerase family protein [Sphingomonas sp.]|nr:enoyl-CoA hydratase/isomerase family protein [Sphingomonas sp.]
MVLQGSGDTFCAGDDLRQFNEWKEDDFYWQVRFYQETVEIIENMTALTIAAVDGVCAGGGLELTLVCDFVVATDRFRWGMPEIDWDITPGWGGISRLSRFAGRRKAKERNLIGNLFDAATAERYNLCNRVCAADQLNAEVEGLCEVLLAKHPLTTRRTKFALNKSFDVGRERPGSGSPDSACAARASGAKGFYQQSWTKTNSEIANNQLEEWACYATTYGPGSRSFGVAGNPRTKTSSRDRCFDPTCCCCGL